MDRGITARNGALCWLMVQGCLWAASWRRRTPLRRPRWSPPAPGKCSEPGELEAHMEYRALGPVISLARWSRARSRRPAGRARGAADIAVLTVESFGAGAGEALSGTGVACRQRSLELRRSPAAKERRPLASSYSHRVRQREVSARPGHSGSGPAATTGYSKINLSTWRVAGNYPSGQWSRSMASLV